MRVSSKVNYSIECLPEDEGPEGHFGYATEEENQEAIRYVYKLADQTPWGWCRVKVTAERNGVEGHDYLGGCSYRSEKDFKRGGYWMDMKREALRDLESKEASMGVMVHSKRRAARARRKSR